MPPRATWRGFLRLSLVSVPVKAYTAAVTGGGEIHLRQLHADCHSPIQYRKTCPIHGEVTSDAIVSGYEYAKGQFVVVDTDELDKLRTEADKAVTIDTFIRPNAIDPVYHCGKTYYLVPDGPVGQKPYALLHRGMEEEGCQAIARVVMSGREQVVLLRPLEGILAMTMLEYDHQVKKPGAFQHEVGQPELSDEELRLAKTLIGSSTSEALEFSRYKDAYTEKLTALIEAKVAGKEIVAAPAEQEPEVINLMEALRQSVARAQEAAPAKAAAKPGKKMALAPAKEAVEKRKRKKA
ncbi:MAG: Ku protein [Planctomycetes bacterium]|nr:Ku protein [Planctomycetota bacterium]